MLTDDEKVELWRAVAEAVTIPVIAGTGSNDTAHSVQMTARAAECGVDGVLVVTPYYNRPSQAGIFEHFGAVAGAAGRLPVVVYDIPVRTGRRIAAGTMLRLAREVRNVVALKDAAGDPPTTAHLAAHAPAGFEIYCGDDNMTLPFLAVGAVGVISVASHWVGPAVRGPPSTPSWPGTWPPPSPGTRRCSTRSTSSRPPSTPTRCRPRPPCGRWACRSVSAGCRWARPRPSSTPGRPRSSPQWARRPSRWPRLAKRGAPKPVRVVFLGGLGEIGRNCACIEVEGRIIVVDCGIMFPEPDMPGIDLVLPEFTYLQDRKDRVDGIVLTHGHEDHTGGLAFLLRDLEAPIYGSALTVGLARHRIDEAGVSAHTRFIAVADGERVRDRARARSSSSR